MYIPNLSVVCFFICLSYFIFDCALLLFCAQAWHGKTLSSRNDPIFFCSLHWRNLSLYNKITTTHFKQIRFWWKNVIKFLGKVYSNFFKFVQQLFFLSVWFRVYICNEFAVYVKCISMRMMDLIFICIGVKYLPIYIFFFYTRASLSSCCLVESGFMHWCGLLGWSKCLLNVFLLSYVRCTVCQWDLFTCFTIWLVRRVIAYLYSTNCD